MVMVCVNAGVKRFTRPYKFILKSETTMCLGKALSHGKTKLYQIPPLQNETQYLGNDTVALHCLQLLKAARYAISGLDYFHNKHRLLGDEAVETVVRVKRDQNESEYQSRYKFILACSMYRISQTILRHCEQGNWPNDEVLFEWISRTISGVLSACLTNLPRVIQTMCHHDSINTSEESVQNAARLLGKAKKIIKILKVRQTPNIDQDSMADIEKWRALTESQLPNLGASSFVAEGGSSSSKKCHEITMAE